MKLIEDQKLSRIAFDHGLTFLFEDGSEIRVEVGFRLNVADRSPRFIEIDQPSDYSVEVVECLFEPGSVSVVDGSTLVISLANSMTIEVYPDKQYEAWTFNREDGSLVVCKPGGEISSFGAVG
ncbi:MAG: DUF6188 family protein [Actinobacteria bacterium]|nr:DUF6188 family protein [Actinomycetota bacterium]